MKIIKETISKSNRSLVSGDMMEHKEPVKIRKMESEKHEGFYKGPHNQTLVAGHEKHADGKRHEDHHPAVKMSKGE